MKALIFAIAISIPAASFAGGFLPTQEQNLYCTHVGQVLMMASVQREFDTSPEAAMRATADIELPEAMRKELVNIAYFDQTVIAISSKYIEHAAYTFCMSELARKNRKQYQPLK